MLHAETYIPGTTALKGQVPCYDPSTMQFLGHTKAMTPAEVSPAGVHLQQQMRLLHLQSSVFQQSSFVTLLCFVSGSKEEHLLSTGHHTPCHWQYIDFL